jgi:hypothetical protein
MEEKNVNDILGVENSQKESNEEKKTTKYRYPALRIVAGFYKVLAWIVGIVAIIATFYYLSSSGMAVLALVSLVGGAFLVIGLLAMAELIKVFVDIEYNTRKALEK